MADVAVPTFKKRTNKSNVRKRAATPPPESQNSSDSDYTDDEESGQRVKRRKKDGVTVTTVRATKHASDLSKSTAYTADRRAVITTNDDATKTSHWDTEAANETEAARATARAQREEKDLDGTYKGSAGYSSYIQKNAESGRTVGPVKAPTNVRMVTVTDFAPDVCKDYKQTGFCGFGDSCKFLHAREDYKQGWQLDKEWEMAGKGKGGKKEETKELDPEEKLLESIPFKCIICKEDYKRPVVTKCGHYFCERCAMTRYMKDKKKACANCGADTHGTFNTAKKLNDLLEKKRKREDEKMTAEEQKAADDS